MMNMKRTWLLAALGCLAMVSARAALEERAMARLAPGSVRPEGWVRRQLELQRDGLTGYAEKLYDDIGGSDWLTGGKRGGQFAWERGPYYLKGLVSLAFALDDATLKARAKRWIDAYFASQRPDGDFGTRPRNWWANMIVLWTLRDWCEATGDERAVPFLERYFAFQRKAFADGHVLSKDSPWAVARAGDELDVVLWLYRKTGKAEWLDFARTVAAQSADWTGFYHVGGTRKWGPEGYRGHIVNFMQGLKTPPLKWLLSGDEADRTAFRAALAPDGWVMRQHGRPDRSVNGTEPLSGRSASEGTELCATAEHILSAQVALEVLGDAEIADDLETAAYNTLPATLAPDIKGMRYYCLLNQTECSNANYGFEHNGRHHCGMMPGPYSGFGCCRSNFHLAWPKFTESMWMARGGGLAAVAYGDCTVRTPRATVRETGGYPFADAVTLEILETAGGTWPLSVRIPGWCRRAAVTVNGTPFKGALRAGTFAEIAREWKKGDVVRLSFPSEPAVSRWKDDALAVSRGPLLYALKIDATEKIVKAADFPTVKKDAGGVLRDVELGFPMKELRAASAWNYALVADGADGVPSFTVKGTGLDRRLAVSAVRTGYAGWGLMCVNTPGRPEEVPPSPVPAQAVQGRVETIELVPLALTQLRITLFPWTRAAAGSGKTAGRDDFSGAKWIGGNPVTLPDYDFGPARWIVPRSGAKEIRKTVVLPARPEMAELVIAAHGRFSVEINGLKRWGGASRDLAPCGAFHDWRYPKFVDAGPALRAGTNTIRVVTTACAGETGAVLLSVLLPDGTRVATDETWTDAQVLGGPREVPWGKEMVFRREVNSPRFEKRFSVKGEVRSARLAITGLGFYEAYLNAARVGRKRLDPVPSNYGKRVYYSVYDVTDMLKKGGNVLDVWLGHGWYDVRAVATWNWDMAPWRMPPKMIARLDIETADGARQTVVSDGTWRQVESPVGFDCIREGEVINARHRCAVDLEKNTVNAVEVAAPKGRLVEERMPPTVEKRVIPAKRVDRVGEEWRIDFGEDIAGFMRMRFSDAVPGRTVSFRYDERDGVTIDPDDIRDGVAAKASDAPLRRIDCHFGWTASHDVAPGGVFQCDRYVTRGETGEVYAPRFTYSGFRYVFVKGLGRAPRPEECEAVVLQTDFSDIGSFSCSSPVFNALVGMADRAYKSNFVNGFPTDCPHREKNGWTADAALAGEMAMYCYENTVAYVEWLRQVADSQRADGMIAEIVPTSGWGYAGFLDWDAVIAILPMDLYRYRGETVALEEMYPVLTNYLEKVAIPLLKDDVFSRVRGDWLAAGTRPDNGIVGTCYFKLMCETAAFTARRFGDSASAARYSGFATRVRAGFNRKYYRGNGVYGDARGRQTTQGMALSFGMVPATERAAVERELVKAVEATGGHLDFGLHGMKWVPRALSEAGRSDLAFRMFTKETAPSPATWLKRGGTALWEDWGNGASRNHIMFGEFVCWAYQYLAGIRLQEGTTAFTDVVIEPRFIGDLTWAKATVKLPRGELGSSWKRKDGGVELCVTVPQGTRAAIRLPGVKERVVTAGRHVFAVKNVSEKVGK